MRIMNCQRATAVMDVSESCLCRGVAFKVTSLLREVVACHCSRCRRTSGHFVAATDHRVMTANETLTWYRSSPEAKRGFCNRCGDTLSYRPVGGGTTSSMAGTLDMSTGFGLTHHTCCADNSDYYEITVGLQQRCAR